MMEGKRVRIGVVGLGHWGKNILRNLVSLNCALTACDSNSEVIKERRKEFPEIDYTQSFEEIIRNPEIQAVAIATPSQTHHQLVKAALMAGKDVFVEKPLALSFKDGKELVELAKERKRILMVGHILQYHPAVKRLKELVEKGDLGKVQYIYSNRLNIGRLRVEENILWSFAPHDISVILNLVGDVPLTVSGIGGAYLNEEIYDVTLTTLEFKNKVLAHIFVSWLHPFKEQKLVVVGSKAMAVFDDLTKEKLFVYPHRIEWEKGKLPVAHKAEHYCVAIEEREPLREEMKHFIQCIQERKRPLTDGEEGLTVLKVLEEAEKAIRNKSFSALIPAEKDYFIHPTSIVDENVAIGAGTKIWHFSHILKNTKIGRSCVIGQNVMIGPDVVIGDRCKIQNNVSIYKGVVLEESVFCGPSCVFTNVYNPRAFVERKDCFLETLIKKGATIGANATIVCGVTVGRYAMVGAGAVVRSDVPDYAVVAGVPARQIGWACRCGVSLKKFTKSIAVCSDCGSKYRLKGTRLVVLEEKIIDGERGR